MELNATNVLQEMTEDEKEWALRFCETCDDDEGYDVPKPMMKRLAALGLVKHKGFGWHEQTDLLLEIRSDLESKSRGLHNDPRDRLAFIGG